MSLAFQWRDDYVVDGGPIDDEHKRQFELANRVFAFTNPSEQVDEVTDAVKQLYKYMEFHFDNEQKLMREVGFPEYEQHVQAHKTIINDMNGLLKTRSDLDQLVAKLRHAIVDWVVRHIMDEDKKIAEYTTVNT